MPRLRMRTIGVGVGRRARVTRPWSISGLRNTYERVGRVAPGGGGGGGRTGAARVICGMCAGGAPSMRANSVVGGGIQAGGEPDEQAGRSPRAPPAPITQVGTTARAGRYGACTPCQCGDSAGSAACRWRMMMV